VSQGHEVHFLVGETKRTDIPNIHSLSQNIKVSFNGNRMSIPLGGSKRKIKALLAAEDFDVLHVQVPYHPLLAGRIIRAASPSTVVFGTFHVAPYSSLVTFATKLLAWWSRPSLKRFDAMVSVSTAAVGFVQQTYGIHTDVLPNVIDYQRFANGVAMPQYTDDKLTVLFLGRLVERKGCLTLLRAIAALQSDGNEYPQYRVVICGGGPLEASLKAYVEHQKLESIVEFAGRISEEDKPNYLASADIAAFPSSGGESFGIVLAEAMANGNTAVLGGDNPGYRSVLGARPEQLFSTKDPDELASKLADLLLHEDVRQQAASWGKQQAAQYDVETVGAELVNLYQTVAPNSRKAA